MSMLVRIPFGILSRGSRKPPEGDGRSRRLRRAVLVLALAPVAFWLLCVLGLAYLRFFPPVITGVQIQRSVERVVRGDRPIRDYRWRSVDRISPHLPRAVVAAEDARFFRHGGFDWVELRRAREQAEKEGEPMRGASTLTQQLVKNLFLTTHRTVVRKAYEWALTLPAEWILGKDRILELYVNVVEFGPGIYGAEAAARHHFGVAAADLSRTQAAGLAAVLPDPLARRPGGMGWYTDIIRQRMRQMGW